MNPEPDPTEELLAVIREAQAEFGGRVEELRAEGIELGGLMKDCERLAAALEAGTEEPGDVQAFTAKLKALTEKVGAMRHLQGQAEAVKVRSSLPGNIAEVERGVATLRGQGGAVELRSATDLEASVTRIREELAAGGIARDALQDVKLTVQVQLAEWDRRDNFRKARWGLFWEKAPPERWAKRSPEQRMQFEGLLAEWRKEKEKVLGPLPLEDRRRLEALRYGDFEKPDACEP
jgi:hypothetical protein